MLRVRVSTVEAFRRLVVTEYGDDAALTRVVRGVPDEPNWMMEAGTAYHALLADQSLDLEGADPMTDRERVRRKAELMHAVRYDPPRGEIARQQIEDAEFDDEPDWIPEGDYSFTANAIARGKWHVGPGLFEVTGRRVFDVGGRRVEVQGTADHVRGLALQDHKCKFTSPDARDYEHSLQWRLYLVVHEAQALRYNLFCFTDPDGKGRCSLNEIVSFGFWRYAGIEKDCVRWLGEFLSWADSRGLLSCLEALEVA